MEFFGISGFIYCISFCSSDVDRSAIHIKYLYNLRSNTTTKAMTLKALELTEEERANLETLARGRRDWRTRDPIAGDSDV
jgi:hypothetical protein